MVKTILKLKKERQEDGHNYHVQKGHIVLNHKSEIVRMLNNGGDARKIHKWLLSKGFVISYCWTAYVIRHHIKSLKTFKKGNLRIK